MAAGLIIPVLLLMPAPAYAQPQRIVSLNLCTDQMALMLAPRETIRSLSYLSVRADIAAASDRASGLPLNHGRAEEILPLAPDIVLAGRYTSRPTVFLLKRLGYNVLDQDISRSIADVRERVREAGRALGRADETEAEVAAMDRRLATLAPRPGERRPTAVYYQPNGYTAGADTLVGDIIAHAGLDNLGARAGVRGHGRMTLETLLELQPEILIVDDRKPNAPALAYEVLRHPALKALIDRSEPVIVPTRLWICGIPAVVDAVEILAAARAKVIAGSAS
jgi:iron complex transport system substrate-binding protein